LPTAL